MKEKTVVVKVHLEGSLPAVRELLAISILQGTKFEQNTVRHVCDFVCMDDMTRWMKPVSNQVNFCNGGSHKLHFFVMEYIRDGDVEKFFQRKDITIDLIQSMFLQTFLAVVELGCMFKLSHSDLNSGNILVTTTDKKRLKYVVFDKVYKIGTCGFVPILIDFGRCTRYGSRSKNIMHILENASFVLHILGLCAGNAGFADIRAKALTLARDNTFAKREDVDYALQQVYNLFDL